ncbi:MAG: glycosyltransferase [Bacteroidetes bacterium]|nr:glycosyltransferase [Bacteroidota bacterium]MBS1930117.1 glycosyltransferase [Bacteroidota bacterium]
MTLEKRRVTVSVISDLVSDQRVHRVCTFLQENGFEIALIGRRNNKSLLPDQRNYSIHRIRCYFNKGVMKYAEFNWKLFIKLLFKKTDMLLSNDLDTLVPNFIISKLRRKKLVYDTHEYFTGMPELQNKPIRRRIWKTIEKIILPRIKKVYTVSESVANQYEKDYGVKLQVIRNTPILNSSLQNREDDILPKGKTILLLQGSGINKDRGAEELIESMTLLPDNFLLVLIGGGECWEGLKSLTLKLNLKDKVMFIEKVPFEELKKYTSQAYLGFSLDKPTNLNYRLSLPNKIFDYIHAGVPIVASEITEVKKILETYQVGTAIPDVTPQTIAAAVLSVFKNQQLYERWKQNTTKATEDLCWQKEQLALKEIFKVV